MLRKLILFTIAFTFSATVQADGGRALYTDRIYQIQGQGHMSSEDAIKRVHALQLKNETDHREFREQARGIASAIRGEKVIKLSNKAIEVFVE